MPESASHHDSLARIAGDAQALRQRLRRAPIDGAPVLADRIIQAQELAATALRLLLDLARNATHDQEHLLHLDHLARITKTAQDVSAELTAALSRAVENECRRRNATTSPPVLLRPTPQQFIDFALDLLDGLPAAPVAPAR
ncbi:hypothetical protein ACN2WE_30705 [Streptomyces sp. cg28]|uniref:hypothetical protein n=1 Tax=Streptomyces sp. cg28 TaxID=3403457 RepID=UPI003B21158A